MIAFTVLLLLVLPLLNAIPAGWQEYILLQDVLAKRKPKGRAGYVYFVTHNSTPHIIKIGRAVNVHNRIVDFNTFAPYGVWLLATIKCRNASYIEAYLHQRLAHLRSKGEWFHVDFVLFVLILCIHYKL